MTDGPYARLYLAIWDDEKFAAIYDDDHHFAAWCRLLMIAEPAWPSSAHLPVTARRASVQALADAKLIEMLPGGRYRICGLDAEREKRAQHAQRASNARWNARSIPAGNAHASDVRMPNQDRVQEQAEPIPANASASDPVVVYANLTGGWPAPGAMDWLDNLSERFGDIEVIKALGEAAKTAGRGRIIGETRTLLEMQGRELAKREKVAEKAKVDARRLDGMMARRLEWFRNTGQWDPAWGDPPVAA